jgi:hypothetical protein
MESKGRSIFRWGLSSWLAVMTAIMLLACGGGSSSPENSATADVTFRVLWDRSDSRATDYQRASLTDCEDVETVNAGIFTAAGTLMSEGGPWSCAVGSGVITGVPANYYAIIAVAGHGADGLVLYRGQSTEAVFLDPESTVDAGLIVAGTFVPTLASPANEGVVAPAALQLQWNEVPGAAGYQVSLATDDTFGAGAIVQEISVPSGSTISVRPDVSDLQEDTSYYWRVQALDGAANLGAPSLTRVFSLSTALLSVTITSPPNNAMVKLGADTTFTAEAADASGTPLSAEELAVITWSSSIDGPFGSQLSFMNSSLTEGTHTITLTLEDMNGLTGSAVLQLNVVSNLPPTASILDPPDGATFIDAREKGIDCQGSGTDFEDGPLPDSSLIWSLVNLDDPGAVPPWTSEGTAPHIDGYYFTGGAGLYRITLEVTDSQGATDTVSHDVTVN